MRRFFKSFVWAKNGIVIAIKEERNMRVHICVALYVYIFSALFYSFSATEYAIITILVGGVMALELVNSAIERAVDSPSDKHYVTAGQAKDIAAGAVLVFCVISAVCAVFLFWDLSVFLAIFSFFKNNLLYLVLFLVSLVISYMFIFRKEDK